MRYGEGEALNEPKEKGPVVAFGSGHGDRAGSCHYVFRFGSKENMEEISSKMEKLVLCMEVGAWEKAEVFTHNIKSFVEQGPKEIKKAAFRLEMTVRREDLAKSMEQYGKLKELLQAQMQGQKPAATEKTE